MTKRTRLWLLAAAVAPLLGLGIQSAHAAPMYWDIDDSTPGAGGTSVTGTWNASLPNWTLDSTGSSAATTWNSANVAVFSAGTNATGASSITVSPTQTAAGLTIEEGTISFLQVSGSGVNTGANPIVVNSGATLSIALNTAIQTTAGSTLTLNGGTLRNTNAGSAGTFFDVDTNIILGSPGGTLNYSTSNSLSIMQTGSLISGSGNLTKAGAGVLAIVTPATYGGSTTISAGEIRVRTNNNVLPTGTAVSVSSGAFLNLNGLSQQIGSITGAGSVGTGNGTLTIGGSNNTSFSGVLKNIANAGASGVTTGNGKLIRTGTGTTTFNGLNDITGSVTINSGGIVVGASGALSGPLADLTVNGGTLTLNNLAQTIENLSGSGGTINLGNGHTLTTDPVANTSYAGVLAGLGGLTKANVLSGATLRTLTLTGNNTFSGTTKINGGAILASAAAGQALGGTSRIEVTGATATLTLGNNNQINNTAQLVLDGAMLNTGGFDDVAGAMDLVASSIIDMGNGDSVFAFANSSAESWAGTVLNVYNWTGNINTGGGIDQLIFGSDATGLSATQLEKIVFFADAGTTQVIGDTVILSNGEVVPLVPEPGTLTLLGLGAFGLLGRRRRNA